MFQTCAFVQWQFLVLHPDRDSKQQWKTTVMFTSGILTYTHTHMSHCCCPFITRESYPPTPAGSTSHSSQAQCSESARPWNSEIGLNTLPLWSLFSEEVIRCSTTRCKSSVSRWKWISKVFTKVQLFCIVKISVATRLAWRGKFSLRIFASFVSQGGCRWIGYQ